MGHYHEEFAVCWPKLLRDLTHPPPPARLELVLVFRKIYCLIFFCLYQIIQKFLVQLSIR